MQVTVQPFQWSTLSDINAVPPFSEQDAQCFAELRDVLERHGALDRFGISLLHSHFPVAESECLVETINTENGTLIVRPVPRGQVTNAVQTQWKLTSGEATQLCYSWCERYPHGDHRKEHQWRPDVQAQ